MSSLLIKDTTLEERIRIDLGENVRLKAIRKKPFFWDT